jgi:hypothetical protein
MNARAGLLTTCLLWSCLWALPRLQAQSTASGSPEAAAAAGKLRQLPVERVRLLSVDEFHGGAALSPDGRWLAYSTKTLHLLPMENGLPAGDPIELISPLTGEPISGGWPQWPANDVLLFTGPGMDGSNHLNRMRIDPRGGRAVEAPRRVSLDPVFRGYALSPSGDSLVYIALESDRRTLKVMSTFGGPALTLEVSGRLVGFPGWDREGRIYYHVQRSVTDESAQLFRVRPGGEPELVGEFGGKTYVDPDAGTLLYPLCFNNLIGIPACGPEVRLATLDGLDLGTVDMQPGWGGYVVEGGAAGDLYVTAYREQFPIWSVDLQSGETTEVCAEGCWSVNTWLGNTRLSYSTGSPSGSRFREFDLTTGVARDLDVPDVPGSGIRLSSPDGRWLLYGPKDPERPRTVIHLRDLETGSDRILTDNGTWTAAGGLMPHITGRGGYRGRDGQTFLFSTEQSGVQDIWRVEADGSPWRLWRFPAGRSFVPTAVRADWLVFPSHGPNWAGDPAKPQQLLLARPGMTEPQVLYEAPAGTNVSGGTWSRDGRRIAFTVGDAIRVLDIQISGDTAAFSLDSRQYAFANPWGGIYWDAEDEGLVVLGYRTQDDSLTGIWHLDLRTGQATPVNPPQEGMILEMRMSPDGRRIAYDMERITGVDLWRVRIGRPRQPVHQER